jgi:hypothetical protein
MTSQWTDNCAICNSSSSPRLLLLLDVFGRPPCRIRGPARNQDLELDLEIARGSKQGGILVLSANASHGKLRVVY